METVIAKCGGTCFPIAHFPWLWWGVSVIAVYLIGWLWYSKWFTKRWCESEQLKCKCGADMAKGEKCSCEKRSFLPMILQLAVTALTGFTFFLLTSISVWLAVIVALAVLAWEKVNVFFRVMEFKRACRIIWIEVGYYCVALIIFTVVAVCLKHCACGAACCCTPCG